MKGLLAFIFLTNCLMYSQSFDFPMHVGDYWEYKVGFGTQITSRVTISSDTLMPNGHRYSKFVEKYSYGDYEHVKYFRKESNKIVQYFWPDSSEQVIYDFGALVGDTINQNEFGGITFLEEVYSDTVFASRRSIYIFGSYIGPGLIYHIDKIADGLGIIWTVYEPGILYVLRGAIINGIQYGTTTGVNENETETPVHLLLSQNYPNPFNPSTVIRYQLSANSFVTLKIYNTFGQEVASLLNEQKPAGEYSVPFTAEHLPSGVYVYRLSAVNEKQSFAQTRKMLYLK